MIHKGALRGKILSPSTAFGLLPLYDVALRITLSLERGDPPYTAAALWKTHSAGSKEL